jgi:hypothetical protein
MMSSNKNKSMNKCLQLLIKELRHLQHDLESTFCIDDFIHDNLINACQKISACQYTYFKSSDNLTELINNLKSSIIIYQKAHFIEFSFFYRVHYFFHRSSLLSQFSISNQLESKKSRISKSQISQQRIWESKKLKSYKINMLRLSKRKMLINETYKK